MSITKITVQFSSATSLWAFRSAIQVNVFFVNLANITITFEESEEKISWAIEKYHGQIVRERQEV